MIHRRVALAAVALCVVLLPGRAAAQYPYYSQQPSFPQTFGGPYNPQFQTQFSPYLNILRGNAAVNYYGATRGVIPSYQQNAFNNQMYSSLLDLERNRAQATNVEEDLSLLPGTGHPTTFGYYAPYYNLYSLQRIPPRIAPQPYTGSRRSSKQ